MGITALNDFQTAAVGWGRSKSRAIIRASAGSGKSLAMMSLYKYIKVTCSTPDRKFGRLLLVSRPKGVNVFDTAIQFLKLSRVKITEMSDLMLFSEAYDFPSDVYIITSTMLVKLFASGPRAVRGMHKLLSLTGMVGIDELHQYRNRAAKQTKALRRVTDWFSPSVMSDPTFHRIVGVTATVVYKDIMDLYSLFGLIDPQLFGSYDSFVDAYCVMEERMVFAGPRPHSFRKVAAFKNVDSLKAKIAPYVFTWGNDEFRFNYTLHYYDRTPAEVETYNRCLSGYGIDKELAVSLAASDGRAAEVYLDRDEVLYRDAEGSIGVPVRALREGDVVWRGGVMWSVRRVLNNRVSKDFGVRCLRAMQDEGAVEDKMRITADLVNRYAPDSVVLNFCYYTTIDATVRYLRRECPGRRIVELTGKNPDFAGDLRRVDWRHDIVILSKAATESLSMYSKHMVLVESFVTVGGIEQIFGRLTRHDSPYRDFTVDVLLNRTGAVATYFYERLRYLLRTSGMNTVMTFDRLPPSDTFLSLGVEDRAVTIDLLKKRILWKHAAEGRRAAGRTRTPPKSGVEGV